MDILEQYLRRKGFAEPMIRQARQRGWADIALTGKCWFPDGELLFSHRCNHAYGAIREAAYNKLHAHGDYELLIHVRGEAEYIQNDRCICPKPYTAMWSAPGNMHMLNVADCDYERYILYVSPKFFSHNGVTDGSLLQFAADPDTFAFHTEGESMHTLRSLLERIEQTFQSDLPYKNILAKALLIELFDFFNGADLHNFESRSLTDPMAEVKKYIDCSYAEITGIDAIAERFHYSREHLSRRFKSRFNTSISEYLTQRRVIESVQLLPTLSVTDACYAVGFRSQSVFIAAFKNNMGCLPSEYKKRLCRLPAADDSAFLAEK